MKLCQRGTPRRGKEHPAQGNALGLFGHASFRAMKGQKHSKLILLPLQGGKMYRPLNCTQGVALG